jgi:hypothetical protein
MIYTFGNSHAHLFTNSQPATYGEGEIKNEWFTSFSLGATIAYNFFENHYPVMLGTIESYNINKDEDYIMLIIGEVDCRWHLPLQCNLQNKNYQEIVEECISRFFRVYTDLKSKGYKILGWGGHPSTRRGHSENMEEPIYGDCYNRNLISKLWNELIAKNCEENNIEFITIMDEIIDSDGLTNESFFMDYCHLDFDKCKNILKEKFLEKGITIYE